MRNTRRVATMGLSIVAIGSLFAGTAGAQATAKAGEWGGTATAEALTIRIAGQDITTSSTTAELRHNPLAKATATQLLTPAFSSTVEAVLHGAGRITERPDACTGAELSQIPGIVRSDITCGEAVVEIKGDTGLARGRGAELILEPSVSEVLETIQLQQPAQDAVDGVFNGLAPLVEGLTATPIGEVVDDTVETVHQVLDDVLTLQTTARIVVAPALSEVTSDASKVVAKAKAQGVRIELLPADGTSAANDLLPADLLPGEPLITITIGQAEVSKTVAKTGEPGETTHLASLVTIAFGSTALTDRLGLSAEPITVEAGQSFCVPGLEGTPLETCVAVADAGVDADGNPFANGASVELFKGVSGGIDIGVGRATTAGAAAPAPVIPAAPPVGELPRTGGEATIPLVAGGLLALAAATRRLVAGRR